MKLLQNEWKYQNKRMYLNSTYAVFYVEIFTLVFVIKIILLLHIQLPYYHSSVRSLRSASVRK